MRIFARRQPGALPRVRPQVVLIGNSCPLAAAPDRAYVIRMLGRVLFAVVCLIIATGLLLPIYPADVDVASPGGADAQDMLITDAGPTGCRGCATAAARVVTRCLADAPASAAAVPAGTCVRLTVYLVVRPLPAPGPAGPQLLPPKIPTI
jgi:hypothetical protein